MLIKVIVISAFALMIITVGIMGMRKTHSFTDFFLGGGNIGPWMTAFTYGTAYFSAVLFMGLRVRLDGALVIQVYGSLSVMRSLTVNPVVSLLRYD